MMKELFKKLLALCICFVTFSPCSQLTEAKNKQNTEKTQAMNTSAHLETRFPMGSYHQPHRENFPDPVNCRTWKVGKFGIEEVDCLPSDLPDGYSGQVVMQLVDSENIVIDLAIGPYGEEDSFRATYVLPR